MFTQFYLNLCSMLCSYVVLNEFLLHNYRKQSDTFTVLKLEKQFRLYDPIESKKILENLLCSQLKLAYEFSS